MAVLVSLIRHEPLPFGCFIPEPWSACEPCGPL
jgi:hypothetical protein